MFVSTCVTKSSDPTSPMCHFFKGPNYALRWQDFTHVSTSQQAEQGWKTYQLPKGPSTYNMIAHLAAPCWSSDTQRGKKEEQKHHVGAVCLHVFWAMLDTHLESHQSSKASKNTFLITNKCTILVGLLKMAQEGLRRGGVLCLLAQVGGWEGTLFSLVMISYWKGISQPGTGARVGVVL